MREDATKKAESGERVELAGGACGTVTVTVTVVTRRHLRATGTGHESATPFISSSRSFSFKGETRCWAFPAYIAKVCYRFYLAA